MGVIVIVTLQGTTGFKFPSITFVCSWGFGFLLTFLHYSQLEACLVSVHLRAALLQVLVSPIAYLSLVT